MPHLRHHGVLRLLLDAQPGAQLPLLVLRLCRPLRLHVDIRRHRGDMLHEAGTSRATTAATTCHGDAPHEGLSIVSG